MNNLHKIHPPNFLIVLLVCFIIQPSGLLAQISNNDSDKDQRSVTNSSSRANPDVIFKIARDNAFFENPLYLDLPAGASFQYNGEGVYQINNMPDVFGPYNIKMRSGGDILNGVTTADISLIQRHILGKGPLGDAYKLIAADVNCDGRISAKDLVDIRRAILERIDKFECNTNFAFSPNSLIFEWTGSPIDLGVILPIKLGDVNSSAKYNSGN